MHISTFERVLPQWQPWDTVQKALNYSFGQMLQLAYLYYITEQSLYMQSF